MSFFLFVGENFELKKQCAEVSSAKPVVRTDWLCKCKDCSYSLATNVFAFFVVKFIELG